MQIQNYYLGWQVWELSFKEIKKGLLNNLKYLDEAWFNEDVEQNVWLLRQEIADLPKSCKDLLTGFAIIWKIKDLK